MVDSDPQSPSWEGHRWSDWHALDLAIVAWHTKAPGVPGLYRIRCRGEIGLIYIGETGNSLLGRFRQLRKATQYAAAGKKPGPPHVAGGCVGAHEKKGLVIEISWIETPQIDNRDRKGIECELIAAVGRLRARILPVNSRESQNNI